MVFLFSLLDCWVLIFLWVYFIVTLSDLECEYIDASSCCSKLNKWVIPELVGHTLVTAPMLIHCTGSSPFSTYLLLPGIYIGILWCPVVTWEYLIQQKYTIEGSWSRTWKKPWSNSASTSSVSSCIFTGEFVVLLTPCLLLMGEILLFCEILFGHCRTLGVMWISCDLRRFFLCHVIESAFCLTCSSCSMLLVIP